MCLYNFIVNKKDLFNDDKDCVILYKVVRINPKKGTKYITPYQEKPIPLNKEFVSDRKSGIKVNGYEYHTSCINKGIHVCITLEHARTIAKYNKYRKILRCKCYRKNYIAHSIELDAVFTKIKILKGEIL